MFVEERKDFVRKCRMKERTGAFIIMCISLTLLAFSMGFFDFSQFGKTDLKESTLGQETGEERGSEDVSKLFNPPSQENINNKGKILFSANRGDTQKADYDLYSMNSDGSEKTRHTNEEKFINHPVWSPEYSRIAYSANAYDETGENRDKIFIMTADGSEKKQITFGDSFDKFPTWSPDGKFIAYISYREKIPNLFVVDIYGKNERQLTFEEGKSTVLWPSWSPVGDVIAFSYNEEGEEKDFRLHEIRSDGSGRREILSSNNPDLGDSEPGWSPDGKILYFLSNRSRHGEIWKLNYEKWKSFTTEGKKFDEKDIELKQISNLYSRGIFPDHRPRVSPDGQKIVFYGVGSDWKTIGTNLYTCDIDGKNVKNITKSIDGNEWPDW